MIYKEGSILRETLKNILSNAGSTVGNQATQFANGIYSVGRRAVRLAGTEDRARDKMLDSIGVAYDPEFGRLVRTHPAPVQFVG